MARLVQLVKAKMYKQIMTDLLKLVSEYAAKDVYNMDEIGLFWKMAPDRSLGTEMHAGQMQDKVCFSQ